MLRFEKSECVVLLNALPSKTMALFLILTFVMFINLNYIIINTNKKINL